MIYRTFMALVFVAAPAFAESESHGTLNPDEMTWQSFKERAENGETGMVICSHGYAMTKSGDHETARTLFRNCARDGYTGAMTWMSYMDQNGFGGDYDPEASAEWDRMAAEAGDPVGQFNYGLDLMRGHGVAQDEEAGRRLIDEAAASGLPIARRMQDSGYDLDEVTPDADNWKYSPLF